MKRVLASVLLVVLVVTALSVPSPALDEGMARDVDWPQRGGDAGGSGYNPTATSPTNDVGPEWITRVGFGQPPIVVGETVYVANYDGEVLALSTVDGSERWSTAVGDTVNSGVVAGIAVDGNATVLNGLVYTVAVEEHGRDYDDQTYHLVALDAATGERIWTTDLHTDTPGWATIYSPVAAHGFIYLSGTSSTYSGPDRTFFVAFDADTGEERWEVTPRSVSAPLVVDDVVVNFEEYQGSASAYNATTGDLVWEADIDAAVGFAGSVAAAVSAPDGTIYAQYTKDVTAQSPTRDRTIVHVDGSTGTVTGTHHLNVSYYGFAVTEDRLYAVSGDEHELLAIDRVTGDVVWRFVEPDNRGLGAVPTASSNLVFIGNSHGTVYALDPADGSVVWTFTTAHTGLPVWDVVPVGETVYVGPVYLDDRIYALRAGGTATVGPFGGFDVYIERMLEVAATMVGFFVQVVLLGVLSAVIVGSLLGGLVYGLMASVRISDAPPRLFAAKVFGVSYEAVTRRQLLIAHLLASIGFVVLIAAVTLPLGGGFLSPVGPIVGVAVAAVVWAVLAFSWLPNVIEKLDRDLERVKFEWGVVHLVFGLVGGLAYTILLWILILLVFQPFA